MQSPEAGLAQWLRKRGLSITIVFAILFLLLASLVITALGNIAFRLDQDAELLWRLLNFISSLLIMLYEKDEMADLTPQQRKALKVMLKTELEARRAT